jgi:hypothetical protein
VSHLGLRFPCVHIRPGVRRAGLMGQSPLLTPGQRRGAAAPTSQRRLAQGGGLQRPVRNAISAVVSRRRSGCPSRRAHAGAQHGIAVGKGADLYLRLGGPAQDRHPLVAQRRGGGPVRRFKDWCQAPNRSWSATTWSSHLARTRAGSVVTSTAGRRRPGNCDAIALAVIPPGRHACGATGRGVTLDRQSCELGHFEH